MPGQQPHSSEKRASLDTDANIGGAQQSQDGDEDTCGGGSTSMGPQTRKQATISQPVTRKHTLLAKWSANSKRSTTALFKSATTMNVLARVTPSRSNISGSSTAFMSKSESHLRKKSENYFRKKLLMQSSGHMNQSGGNLSGKSIGINANVSNNF